MVHNWARGVAVEITWETAIEFAKIRRVVAINDSTVNRVQALKTLEEVGDRVRILTAMAISMAVASAPGSLWHSTKRSGAVTLQPLFAPSDMRPSC
jgi:hypothetical protein